ncbi:pyrophosphatase [Synechococcus phage S-H25]|nr:pyrophosphatase [Synechococcus phage S-H25]
MIDPKKYVEFCDAVTSKESQDYSHFAARLFELEREGFPTQRLLTAAVGMSAEAGEFTEVVKKMVFQGKPVNEDNLFHLKRELGDIMWYVAQACIGLNITLDEIIEMNVDKLVARYPGGEFDVHYSENRKEGDV